ncbi:MAG: hypothetical protein AAF430_09260 [Myxococcota bacterium]
MERAALLLAFMASLFSWGDGDDPPTELATATAAQIRAEASRSSSDPDGAPLPLASHWNGKPPDGVVPADLVALVEAGHHVLPAFKIDIPNLDRDAYFRKPLERARELGLPISLVSTQWEAKLLEPRFRSLPKDETPCLVDRLGNVKPQLSPVGPIEHWHRVGQEWTGSMLLARLQTWYPDPPFVLFVSNNEAPTAALGADRRPAGSNAGFRARYARLLDGMRQGLDRSWRTKARFIGYNIQPAPEFLGRWSRWRVHARYQDGQPMNRWTGVWDGGSAPFYTHDWSKITDHTVWSPQVQAMNWVPFLERETYRRDPDWWHEISVWDGDKNWTKKNESKRAYYRSRGQVYTAERYRGMVQFGMWLTRPRLVREFRHYSETARDQSDYFRAVLESVDRVHEDPTLRRFWRKGKLVSHPTRRHPYQVQIPPPYRDWPRWYLLETDQDPQRPWKLETRLPVYAIARVLGKAPEREWLLYTHSPLDEARQASVAVPGFGVAEVRATISGTFHLLSETQRTVTAIAPGATR